MLHDDHIKSTGLCGSECVFDLQELEFHICDLADQRNGEDDSVAEERWSKQTPQQQTPDAPPSPGPPTIPDNFPMYENWEKFTHQGESFTISYRQQINKARSEIITTLIDCFSELNKYTSSHPETGVGMSPGEKHVIFHITLGLFSILIMFYRKITFSDAVKSYQSCQHQHTPHQSPT